MKKKRVSITDIAKALNVTPSTVSRALNGGGKVSEKKKQQIQALAKELGYRPNPIARSLVENKTQTIGLIIPEFTHHFYSRVLAGIESVTSKVGYQLLICTSNEKKRQEIKSFQTLLDARVDGILATICKKNDEFGHLQEVLESGTPLVLMDRICEEIETSYVISDDFEGAFQAVDFLLQTGCTQIIHIKGPKVLSTSFNRFMGYKEALRKHQIPYNKELIFEGNDPELPDKIRAYIKANPVDGIFAYSDYLAFEAVNVLRNEGISIPDQVAIVGYADEPISTYVTPQLTSVNQRPFDMGSIAAGFLLNQIQAPNSPLEFKSLKTELVTRSSTKKKPQARSWE